MSWRWSEFGLLPNLSPKKYIHDIPERLLNKNIYPRAYIIVINCYFKRAAPESNSETDPASALDSGVLNPLLSLTSPPQKRFILIDGLDESLRARSSKSIVNVLSARLHRFPPWLHIITSARREPEILLRLSRLGISEIAADDHRNIQDIDQYLDSRIKESKLSEALELSGRNLEDVKRQLQHKGEGNFLYIQQALEGIERKRYSFNTLGDLPPGLSGLYLNFFERYFPDAASFSPLQRLLETMVAAQEPLTAEQLAAAAGLNLDALYQILNQLSVYLPSHKENGQERYACYHKSLADWLVSPTTRGTPYYISEYQGHRHLSEVCITLWEKQIQEDVWKDYVEQYAPLHLLLADHNDRFIALLLKFPERIKAATADAIGKIILEEQGNIDAKVEKFLRELAFQQDWTATNTLMTIAFNLLDCNQSDACQRVVEILPDEHPHKAQIKLALDLRACVLESRTEQVIKLAEQLLSQEDLPNELQGFAQYHLAEGLRVSGRFLQAMNTYKQAVNNLSSEADFMAWMQASCALGDLEYVYGRLDGAHSRLATLLEKADARKSVIFSAVLHRLSGQVYQIVGDYALARVNFEESLSLFRQARRPINTVEALNSLAQTEIYLKPDRARELLKQSRALAEKCEANLELGKSFWIEAELQFHFQQYTDTLILGQEAENRLSMVGYEAGIAKLRTLMAQAYLRLSDYGKAAQSALAAHQFLIQEQIYPSYRLQAYHALMEAALPMGQKEFYQGLDNPTQIPFIENYPNMRMLLDHYRKGDSIGGGFV